jgi:hypothetical protein
MDATPARTAAAWTTPLGIDTPRDTDNIMNLATLYHLLNSFTDEKRYLETTTLLTDDPSRQAEIEQRAKTIATIVTDIRGEVLAREIPGERSPSTAQEFETHLYRILKAYDSLDPVHGENMRQST